MPSPNNSGKRKGKVAPATCDKCGRAISPAEWAYFGECPQCGASELPINSGGRVSQPEKHDRGYHGGQFNKGEW